jgi:hypothetical protein
MMRRFCRVVVSLSPCLLVSLSAFAQPALPELSLDDQFEQRHDLTEYRGAVLVLVYGDRAAQTANQALGERLHVAFHPDAAGRPPAEARRAPVRPVPGTPGGAPAPDVCVVPVACAGKVPAVVQRLIRSQVKKAAPDLPVWLDFDDRMAHLFGLAPGQPNLIVFDPLGRYRLRLTGDLDAARLAALVQTLDALRAEESSARPARSPSAPR